MAVVATESVSSTMAAKSCTAESSDDPKSYLNLTWQLDTDVMQVNAMVKENQGREEEAGLSTT